MVMMLHELIRELGLTISDLEGGRTHRVLAQTTGIFPAATKQAELTVSALESRRITVGNCRR